MTTSYIDISYVFILCDNTDIYCDNIEYYCDGSVVQRSIEYP